MVHGTKVTRSTARSIRPNIPFPPRTGSPWALAARPTPSPDSWESAVPARRPRSPLTKVLGRY
jgi:hypothetical protein